MKTNYEHLARVQALSAHDTNVIRDGALHSQLLERKKRLQTAVSDPAPAEYLVNLLHEVDAALSRMNDGTYGICETCHDSIENERLLVDPLIRNCIDHLSAAEQRALERDLDLAYQVQNGLLPKPDITIDDWNVAYHYEPAGPVSGDYCDLIIPENGTGSFYFLLGDVSGKGVAASILMAHLHAIFRSLVGLHLPVHELVERANGIFCSGTLSTHFATLVCGRADKHGTFEICNAGHPLPLLAHGGKVESISAGGLPLGLSCEQKYSHAKGTLPSGASLVLYTDGLTESRNRSNEEYGVERFTGLLREQSTLSPRELIGASLQDLTSFRSGVQKVDDLTMMVIHRSR